jgi:hypothetical protein
MQTKWRLVPIRRRAPRPLTAEDVDATYARSIEKLRRLIGEKLSAASEGTARRAVLESLNGRYKPRWTVENRQFVDRAKPAISGTAETSEFYFVPSSARKSVCTFVRQLRGPHFSTCA